MREADGLGNATCVLMFFLMVWMCRLLSVVGNHWSPLLVARRFEHL